MEKIYNNIYMKRFLYFNVYVIKGQQGDILIDTGFILMRRRLKKWLDKFNIKLVILTHAHADHIWNTQYIKKHYDCVVAMGNEEIKNITKGKMTSEPAEEKFKYWTKLMHLGMKVFKPKKFVIDIPLQKNQILNQYGIELKIIPLSGHTTGSIGVLYKDYLFAGDALVFRRNKPSIAYQNQNNKRAKASYSKIVHLKPKIIFLGHDKELPFSKLKTNK